MQKVITKKEFKENVNIHKYGKSHKIGFYNQLNAGYKYACGIKLGCGITEKDLLNAMYDHIIKGENPAYFLFVKTATSEETRFKVPISCSLNWFNK